jgi:hypothetical protein
VFILGNGMASIQPIQNKNMFLVALNACSFPVTKGQVSDFYQTVDKITNSAFVGAFAKLRKVNISFVMSGCLSVRPFVRME